MSLAGNLKNSDRTFILKRHLSDLDIASSELNAKLFMWKKGDYLKLNLILRWINYCQLLEENSKNIVAKEIWGKSNQASNKKTQSTLIKNK